MSATEIEDGVFESTAVIDNGSFGTRTIRFETGRLAKQAAGAVVASNGSGEEGTGAKESHAQAAGPTTADRGVERAGPEQRKAEAAG